ncbi:hypothetical protein IMCC14465_13200 [alpha proteobacterium IMCC14465]|uniref:Sigma-54 factor interaction domain-containing protein n=1 Tax=alpha proteobacterium IMCC14465 TaxID=1220535 RepID=J9E0U5_9PROT|nr:hypothetical protein IMCC14465_13200 [alpha proteobacterium IMCC14465]
MTLLAINSFGLELAQPIGDVLTTRNMAFMAFDAKNTDLPDGLSACEQFVCSGKYLDAVGGLDKFVDICRSLKIKNITVINEKAECFSVKTELGGKLVYVSLPDSESDRAPAQNYGLQLITSMIASENHVAVGDESSHTMLRLAKKVAETDVTVFINGPTGTGKEVLARFVHNHSGRRANPFIAINCAAIPENMLEAILFGHEKGSFTGASTANKGIFRAADTGTLLLDEISEMPLSLQAKLLRALQEKSVTPIGSNDDIAVDVRVLATTNRDIPNEVRAGNFREDLYYRLNVFPLNTISLSERADDIIPISTVLLQRHCKTAEELPWLDESAVKALTDYEWPGNVRELENVLQRALVLHENGCITKSDILTDILSTTMQSRVDQDTRLSEVG